MCNKSKHRWINKVLLFISFHPVLKILKQSSKFTNKKIKTSFRKPNSFSIHLTSPDWSRTYKPGGEKKKKVDSMTLSRRLFEKRAVQMEGHAKLILRDCSISSTRHLLPLHTTVARSEDTPNHGGGAPCASLSVPQFPTQANAARAPEARVLLLLTLASIHQLIRHSCPSLSPGFGLPVLSGLCYPDSEAVPSKEWRESC